MNETKKTVKLMKHYATDGQVKARVWYSAGQLVDGRDCVTLYAKDYSNNLATIFGAEYQNNTDLQTDYFEKGLVRIFPDNPLYPVALARSQKGAR